MAKPKPPKPPTPFEQFVQRIAAVPKAEVDAIASAEKRGDGESVPPKRGRKRPKP